MSGGVPVPSMQSVETGWPIASELTMNEHEPVTPTGIEPSALMAPATREDGQSGRTGLLRLFGVTLALGGWVFGAGVFLYLVARDGGLAVGVDLAAYLRAGDDLVAGAPVYIGQIGQLDAFSYAPPWAVLFGALSWVPDMVMQVGMMALGLLAIRYVAGSWLWSGLVFWYPVSVMVLHSGNIEFLIAAAIVLAVRGHAGPLAFTALAKIAPILAVPRAGWREAALVIGVALLVTLPWLHLWPEWIEYLLRQPTTIYIHIGPPWYVRLPFALALLLVRRPWTSALAVVVAMPSLWLGTLVILTAAIRLWIDREAGGPSRQLPRKRIASR
jgi:hypothetical protein